MDRLKKVARSTKEFIEKHKVAIAVASTAVICLHMQRIERRYTEKFLVEHDLYDEYYNNTEEV